MRDLPGRRSPYLSTVAMRVVAIGAAAIGLAPAGCHRQVVPTENQLVRYQGAVRLAVTAALVAPGKDSGQPWDGPGTLPPQVVQGLRLPPTPALSGQLFRLLGDGNVLAALTPLLPWTANAFLGGFAAPDVQIEISVNGTLLSRSAKVANSYNPTWSTVYTPAFELHDFDQIEIRAIDRDLVFHDQIGVCTSQGRPWVDAHGYVSGQTFQCLGQLWAVALRVVPETPPGGRPPSLEVATAAPSR